MNNSALHFEAIILKTVKNSVLDIDGRLMIGLLFSAHRTPEKILP